MAPTNRIQRVARAVFCQIVYNHRDGKVTCLEPHLRCAVRSVLNAQSRHSFALLTQSSGLSVDVA